MRMSILQITQKVLSIPLRAYYTDLDLLVFQDFWGILIGLSENEISDLRTSLSPDDRKEISLKWNKYIKELERNKVEDFLNGEKVSNVSILEKEGYAGILCEFNLIKDLSTQKRCLMAGSGYHPETLIELKQNYQKITPVCLDYDTQALKASEVYIKQTCSKDILKDFMFIKKRSFDFSYKDENIILLANGLSNKKETLLKIKDTAQKDVNILLRLPQKAATLLYEDVSETDIKQIGFSIISKIQPSTLSKTYLLRSKK